MKVIAFRTERSRQLIRYLIAVMCAALLLPGNELLLARATHIKHKHARGCEGAGGST